MLCHLIITVTHTIQITGIAKIYNIDRTDSGRYKICRLRYATLIHNHFLCCCPNIHAITRFRFKIRTHIL